MQAKYSRADITAGWGYDCEGAPPVDLYGSLDQIHLTTRIVPEPAGSRARALR